MYVRVIGCDDRKRIEVAQEDYSLRDVETSESDTTLLVTWELLDQPRSAQEDVGFFSYLERHSNPLPRISLNL
jgi:hypothetical protein